MINLLNISKNALAAHQFSLGVTSSNIANVNTPGYSRQRPELRTLGTTDVKAGNITLSVNVTEVRRIYDNHLERQVIGQIQTAAYSSEQKSLLARLESIFEESQGGKLADNLNRFWQAWDGLALNPDGWVERRALLSETESLAHTFRDYDASLRGLTADIQERLSDSIRKVNDLLPKIADLNRRIIEVAKDDGSLNSLRDQRTELIKELASKMEIDHFENEWGAANIFLANGQNLVNNHVSELLVLNSDRTIMISGYPGIIINDTVSKAENGQISAQLRIAGRQIPEYLAKLDQLARAITEAVNSQHRLGYDQGGNAGGNFFVPTTTARGMAVNITEPRRIAASLTVGNDGQNARSIALINDKHVIDGTATINQFFASLVGQVGLDLARAQGMDEHRQLVLNNLMQRREEFSGVSIDEEMMNLIKFQLGYNAAGRLVKTADELLETLIRLGS